MRYKLVEGSEAGHDCCQMWSIVDTHRSLKRYRLANGKLTEQRFKAVCECLDRADADMILDLLNKFSVKVL